MFQRAGVDHERVALVVLFGQPFVEVVDHGGSFVVGSVKARDLSSSEMLKQRFGKSALRGEDLRAFALI